MTPSLGTPCLTTKIKTSQQSIRMRGQRVVRIASIHAILLNPRIFILQRQGEERSGWGWGSLGTPINMSSFYLQNEFFLSLELRRPSETTLPYGVSPLAEATVQQNPLLYNKCKKKKKIRPDFSSQQIHCSNGAISFPRETSPEEFGFEATSCHCIMHPTVHHFTRNLHAHIHNQKISCSLFSARKKKCPHHVKRGDLVTYHLYLYFAKGYKKNSFPYNKQLG